MLANWRWRYFQCARTWSTVRVPTSSAMAAQSGPKRSKPSMNSSSSAKLHSLRGFLLGTTRGGVAVELHTELGRATALV